jgi:hypothetical protein
MWYNYVNVAPIWRTGLQRANEEEEEEEEDDDIVVISNTNIISHIVFQSQELSVEAQ